MSDERLAEYLYQMTTASQEAVDFIAGMKFTEFMADKCTQKAVAMSLLLIGEYASKITEKFPEFAALHPEIPWPLIRGLRNRIAHDYLGMDVEVVWTTVQEELPALQNRIAAMLEGAG